MRTEEEIREWFKENRIDSIDQGMIYGFLDALEIKRPKGVVWNKEAHEARYCHFRKWFDNEPEENTETEKSEPKFKAGDYVRVKDYQKYPECIMTNDDIGCIKRVFKAFDNDTVFYLLDCVPCLITEQNIEPYEPKNNEDVKKEPILNKMAEHLYGKYWIEEGLDAKERIYAIEAIITKSAEKPNDGCVEWTPQPFERVLARYPEYGKEWFIDLYSCYDSNENSYRCIGTNWKEIIPYKGNEHLYLADKDCETNYKIKTNDKKEEI